MGSSHWKPLSADLPEPVRDLAEYMRFLLDDKGMSLRRLADDPEVHYSVSTLHRFFSGQAIPPRWLLEVISRRCGGDLQKLCRLSERAHRPAGHLDVMLRADDGREALPAALAENLVVHPLDTRETTAPRRLSNHRLSRALALALVGGTPLGVLVAITMTPAGDAGDRPSNPAGRTPATTPRVALGGELIGNGVFTDTIKPWWRNANVRLSRDDQRLRADIEAGGTDPWDAIIGVSGLWLRKGHSCVLSFDASAERDVTIRTTVQLEDRPYTATFLRGITLKTSMRHFSYQFTSNLTTTRATVSFQFGGPRKGHVVTLDNVSLSKNTAG